MSADPGRIEARLSTFDTAMVVFSLVVGIGIFRTPAIVAAAAQSTALFFGAWTIAGLVALVGALTFAEIGSRFPRAGGYYRVVAECYDPRLAFMLNWAQALLQGASTAGVALIGAEYLAPVVLPDAWQTPRAALWIASATISVLLYVNYRGIRTGARTQNLLSLLKIAMIVGLAALGLALAPPAPAAATPVTATTGAWPARLATALIPCFYAYGGYQMTMNLGADLRDAGRRFPLAITAGMALVVGLYLLLDAAYVAVLGTPALAGSQLAAAALARAVLGPAGGTVVSIAVFLSAAGFVNAGILQMPRSFHAMAADGVLPRAFLRVDPRTQVQEVALLAFGATMLVPAFTLGSFEKLLNYVMFTDALSIAVVASTIFVLRHRAVNATGFAMPGYPLLPGLYLGALLLVAASVLATDPAMAVAGVVILALGWPLFVLGRRLNRPDAAGGQSP
ncbi:MAG: APC family permease [Proteobacteria bacterium]|nr:APC family permease [Pseudomonadota bacterium]